jgi:hypothetical protein
VADLAAPLVEKTAEPDRAASAGPETGRHRASRQAAEDSATEGAAVGGGWNAADGIDR